MDKPSYVVTKDIQSANLFREKQPRLSRLDLELTERCNNACVHCYINLPANDVRARQRELNTEEWKNILRQAADLGALSVRLTGGEPLLREDFKELYLFTRRLGLKVMLFTNARLITQELADLFTRIPPLKKIEISVYGMRAESYDAVARAPGAYAEFKKGIELLLERQVPFVVKSVMLPANRAEMSEFEAWAATIPWMEREPTKISFLDLRARRDSATKNQRIRELRLTPEEGAGLMTRNGEAAQQEMAQFCSQFMSPPGNMLFTCGAGEIGCVDAYGMFQMCMALRHPEMVYDLKQGSLEEALNQVFPRWRETQASNPTYLERCGRCFLRGLCEQCPGKSWMEHGTLDTPVDYLCEVAHLRAYSLGLLQEGERAWEVADWKGRINHMTQAAA